MFLLRGMERLPEWNLWMHALATQVPLGGGRADEHGNKLRGVLHHAADLGVTAGVTSCSAGGRGLDGRTGGMQAKRFCLVAAAHSSGCSRANRVAPLPVFVFSVFFLRGFTRHCSNCVSWMRANSAAVLRHSDLPLSHGGKAVCAAVCVSLKYAFCQI